MRFLLTPREWLGHCLDTSTDIVGCVTHFNCHILNDYRNLSRQIMWNSFMTLLYQKKPLKKQKTKQNPMTIHYEIKKIKKYLFLHQDAVRLGSSPPSLKCFLKIQLLKAFFCFIVDHFLTSLFCQSSILFAF